MSSPPLSGWFGLGSPMAVAIHRLRRSESVTRLGRALERIGLPAWFITIDVVYRIFVPETLGIDARHYQRATDAWLAGGNPWAVIENGVAYAAGPHTLLFYAPTSLLGLQASTAVWLVAGLVASIWVIRRLHLPLWWLAFPPVAHGIWNANPQTLVVALLVAGGPLAAASAVGLKLYAAIPLAFRWKDLLVTGALLLLTLPLLPWSTYLADGANADVVFATSWNGGAWRLPVLVLPTLAALWVLRRQGAEWLAVPAVWPGTQLYYHSMVLPALVGRPWLAAALAIPVPVLAPVAVIAVALRQFVYARRATSSRRPDLTGAARLP